MMTKSTALKAVAMCTKIRAKTTTTAKKKKKTTRDPTGKKTLRGKPPRNRLRQMKKTHTVEPTA